jgi:hypothetical protein
MILLIAIILFIILVLCQVRKKDRQEGYGYTVNDYSVQWSNKAGIENNVQKWIFVFVNKKGEKYHTKQFEKGIDPDTMFKNFTTIDNTKLIDNKTFDVDISGTNKLKVYYNTEDTNNFITEKEFVYSDFGIALSDVQFTVPPPEKAYYSWKYYKKQIQGVSQLKDLVPDNSGTVETLGPQYSYEPIYDFINSNDFDYSSEGTLYYEGHFYANQVIDLFSRIDYQIKSDNDFMKIYIDGKLQLNIDSDAYLVSGTMRRDELNYAFIKDQTHKIQIITTSEYSMYLFFYSKSIIGTLENEIYFTKKKFKYNDPVNIPEDAVGEIIEIETEIDRTGEFVWQLFEDNGYLAIVSSFLDLTPTKTGLTKTIKNKTDGTGGTLLNNSYKDNYGVKWTGYFVPKKSGYHGFNTQSDDMSYLYIDGVKVVDNGDLHGMRSRYGYVTLEKDKTYKLEIYFSEKGGGDEIIVKFHEPFSYTWKDTFDGYLTPFDYEPLLTSPPPIPTYNAKTVDVDEETKKVTVTLYGITNPDPYYTLKIGDKVEYQFTENDAGTTLEFEWYETSYGYKSYGLYMNTKNVTSVNFEVKPLPISYKISTNVNNDGKVTLKVIDIVNADPYYTLKIGNPVVLNYQFKTGDTEKTFTFTQEDNTKRDYYVYINNSYEQKITISTRADLTWRYFEDSEYGRLVYYTEETSSGVCNNISSLKESIGVDPPGKKYVVLWEGAFVPETGGEYTFKSETDGDVNVEISMNGEKVIFNSLGTGTIDLETGKSYFFRVVFYDSNKGTGDINISYKTPGSDEFTSEFSSIIQMPMYYPLVRYEVYKSSIYKNLPQVYEQNIPDSYLVKAGTTSNLGSKNDIIGDFFDEATTGVHMVKIVITYTPRGVGDSHYWLFSSSKLGPDYNSLFVKENYDEPLEHNFNNNQSYKNLNDYNPKRGKKYEFTYWIKLNKWDDDFNIRLSRQVGGDGLYNTSSKPLERVNYMFGANTEIEQAKQYTPTCKPWNRNFDENPLDNAFYKDFIESSDDVYDSQEWESKILSAGWPSKCEDLNDDKKECKQRTDGGYYGYYNTYKTYKTCQWR